MEGIIFSIADLKLSFEGLVSPRQHVEGHGISCKLKFFEGFPFFS